MTSHNAPRFPSTASPRTIRIYLAKKRAYITGETLRAIRTIENNSLDEYPSMVSQGRYTPIPIGHSVSDGKSSLVSFLDHRERLLILASLWQHYQQRYQKIAAILWQYHTEDKDISSLSAIHSVSYRRITACLEQGNKGVMSLLSRLTNYAIIPDSTALFSALLPIIPGETDDPDLDEIAVALDDILSPIAT